MLAASCVARHLTVPWYVLPQHYFDAAALLHGAPWSDICLRLPAAALRSTRRICKNRAQPHDSRLRSPATALVRKLYNIVTRRRSSMQHDHTLQYYGQLDISSCRCSEIVVTCNRRRAPSGLTSFCQRCGFNSTLQCFHRNAAAARWRLSFITESTRLLETQADRQTRYGFARQHHLPIAVLGAPRPLYDCTTCHVLMAADP